MRICVLFPLVERARAKLQNTFNHLPNKHLFLLCIGRMINPRQITANNYRHISLTCILCKIMEHVLCSPLSNHPEINNILTPHQHCFRKEFSTETQLISVLDGWLSSRDKRIRTDVLLIDFSKAFDSVLHQRLLLKLKYYGITGNSLSWIKNFLLDRTQCVQVSGTRSS